MPVGGRINSGSAKKACGNKSVSGVAQPLRRTSYGERDKLRGDAQTNYAQCDDLVEIRILCGGGAKVSLLNKQRLEQTNAPSPRFAVATSTATTMEAVVVLHGKYHGIYHGTPRVVMELPSPMEFPWRTAECRGFPWTSAGAAMELNGVPWSSMETPWNSIPWNSMEFHGTGKKCKLLFACH